MKKLLIYSFAAMSLLASCTKSDNPKLPDLAQVPPPLITVDASGDQTISAQDPTSFSGKFKVALYYPSAAKPKKFDIVVEKDGDPTNVKTLKSGVTSFPTDMTVTGAQLTTLFGDIVLGNSFTIGANVTTQDGTVYPAFPTSGAAAFPAADFAAPGFSPTVTYSAVCKFIMTDYGAIGSTQTYNVIQDDWDGEVGSPTPATVPVTIIDDTHLSFVFGPAKAKVIITVNPIVNSVAVTKTVIGDYGDILPYGNVTMNDSPGASNYVAPCDLIISINPEFTVSLGSFGNAQIVLQKAGAAAPASIKQHTNVIRHAVLKR